MSTVLAEIAAERRRQTDVEGWSAEHDDQHWDEALALAATCYAHPCIPLRDRIANVPKLWPFHRDYWKPKDRRRDLIRAGALIVAEIERLDRAAGRVAP